MTLKDFIKEHVDLNSVVRLVYKNGGGHTLIADNWGAVSMAWKIIVNKGIYKEYCDNKVLCVTDIFSPQYPEAINIVIEKDLSNSKK